MFKHIMVPVDLAHVPALEKALQVAASLARANGAQVTYAGVTGSAPGAVAATPAEYAGKLGAFGDEQAAAHGIETATHAIVANDPGVDIDIRLIDAADETGADLVVMASHTPGAAEYLWSAHGGKVAAHARMSVLLVRPD